MEGLILLKAYEYGEEYDLGEAQCPECEYPVIGYFRNGVLVRREHCAACGWSEVE